jgi:hypothetical protein
MPRSAPSPRPCSYYVSLVILMAAMPPRSLTSSEMKVAMPPRRVASLLLCSFTYCKLCLFLES